MFKPLLVCAAFFTLYGCANPVMTKSTATTPPKGMFKLLEDDKGSTWADLRSVSRYKGNDHLRRIYIINNYIPPRPVSQWQVSSSRTVNVINCDTFERASFDKAFMTLPFGEGDIVATSDEIGRWSSFPKESLIGIVAESVCRITPASLKPEPGPESRKPLLEAKTG
ncbi:hypothetical protein PUATCC27989T_04910 [Phytobacter ursingii]|nr:hypothetical protein PUATCC27989T_04910 [Phytobacter ursingii]